MTANIKPPDRVTLRWLYEYVPYSAWASLCGVLSAAFALGITAAIKLPLVQQWFGASKGGYEQKLTDTQFYGYYYTWTKDRIDECLSEEMKLQVSTDGSVKARSTGTMRNRYDKQNESSWVLQGYKHNDNFVMAYVTEHSDDMTGNGVYYLVPHQDEFAGFWIGKNSPTGKVIQCPYVLTRTKKGENQKCEDLWPKAFLPEHGCKETVFPTDS